MSRGLEEAAGRWDRSEGPGLVLVAVGRDPCEAELHGFFQASLAFNSVFGPWSWCVQLLCPNSLGPWGVFSAHRGGSEPRLPADLLTHGGLSSSPGVGLLGTPVTLAPVPAEFPLFLSCLAGLLETGEG